ncbi:YbaB/EbfC family nucleoid-associated protein [Desulfurobacterium sp.]
MFKGGMGNMGNLMKMARQLQKQAEKMKKEIEEMEFKGSAGGVVEVTVKGTGRLVSVEISPEVVKDGDVEMLGDMIIVAANQAIDKANETMEKEMKKITGGLGIDLGGLF